METSKWDAVIEQVFTVLMLIVLLVTLFGCVWAIHGTLGVCVTALVLIGTPLVVWIEEKWNDKEERK